MSANLIELKLREQPFLYKLVHSILRLETAAEIQSLIEALGAKLRPAAKLKCFHFEISVGATFGLELDGERVLLKVYEPQASPESLRAQTSLQLWLHQNGFPCPEVLFGPEEHEGLFYRFERFEDEGRRADGRVPNDRRLMAKLLMELVALGKAYPERKSLPEHVLLPVSGSPWPKPHNVLFDFEATVDEAEWIDAVGYRFQGLVDSMPKLTLGHMDWGAKHCRIDGNEISVVYDWDSVSQASLAQVVGSAAANYMASWYVEGVNRPTVPEMLDFISDCATFSMDALQADQLNACILYGAGYGARCEHAIRHETDSTENRDFLRSLLEIDLTAMIQRAME